jgi:hypothetical protein
MRHRTINEGAFSATLALLLGPVFGPQGAEVFLKTYVTMESIWNTAWHEGYASGCNDTTKDFEETNRDAEAEVAEVAARANNQGYDNGYSEGYQDGYDDHSEEQSLQQAVAWFDGLEPEMVEALDADGEKLRAMTGVDHGPVFFDPFVDQRS